MIKIDACFKSSLSIKILFFVVTFLYGLNCYAQKDLPSPASSTENIPAGSFIIPMDNDYQNIVPAGQAGFNLKVYGLVNSFLQNGIPVKWAIKSGKDRDGIDFTAIAERIAPSNLPSSTIDFRAGPFIVKDTILPCGISTQKVIEDYGNNVAVYKLNNSVDADIRYTLTHRPKIAVFNNGGNEQIHTKILDAAGISDYEVMDAADISNLKNCYTFASEPHADEGDVSLNVIENIREFVMNGGNFLAQCHAIETYENQGYFLTTSGIKVINSDIKHLYPNSDLAFSQVHTNSQENAGGSIDNFTLANGSEWRPFTYKSITDLSSETVVAVGAHLTDPMQPGGNIFYLGGHDYSKGGGGKNGNVDLSSLEKINALRMYLNVAFIPSGNSNGSWANAGEPSLYIGCSEEVTLGCTPTGPPGSTFLWSPAEGLSCTTCENPVAKPDVNTTYIVTVKNGCIATDTVEVIVDLKPEADFTHIATCDGSTIVFTDNSVNADYWKWDFGDIASEMDNSSSLQNPAHKYSSSGTFKVKLISGILPTCVDTIVKEININILELQTSATPVSCFGGKDGTANVVFPIDSIAVTYNWNTMPVQTSKVATDLPAGVYTITVSAGNDCNYVADVIIETPDSLAISTKLVQPSCDGPGNASVNVTGGTHPYSISWNSNPVQPGNEVNLKVGTHELSVQDANGCLYKSNITMYPPADPVADFNVVAGCAGTLLTFTDNSSLSQGLNPSAIISRSWYFGDASSGNENTSDEVNPVHSFDTAGKYMARLIVTTDKNCIDTIEKPVEVYPLPEVIMDQKAEGCSPVCVNFEESSTITNGSIEGWQWNFGDPENIQSTSTEQAPVHCFENEGRYDVTLTVVTSKGCSATKTFKGPVYVYPSPDVDFGPEIKVCIEDTANTFPVLDAGPGVKHYWHETGDTTQTIFAEAPGKYNVTVTNDWGCSTQATANVKNICPPRLFVGNAFSPDNDGINDLFTVYSVHVGKFQMLIFNRWGEIIFESVDKTHFWDGIYRHEPMPIGVYEWVITYEGDCEEYLGPYKLEGSVTVVR